MSESEGRIAARWWHELQPHDDANVKRQGDRAALARLRRCATVMGAAEEPATLALCRRLAAGEAGLERVALTAAILAQVRSDAPGPRVARQIGKPRNDETALVSELRFRRLVQAETADELLIAFRRMVALADRKLNVADLAGSLLHWNDATRRSWLYAYYDAPDFRPTTDADATSSASEAVSS